MLCESDNFIKCCNPNLKFQEVGNNNLVTNISCHKSVLSWYNVYTLKFIFKGSVTKIISKNKLITG